MYCPNCGTENPDGVSFCTGCGMALAAAAAAPAAPVAPAPVEMPTAQPVAQPVAAPVAETVAQPAAAPAPQSQPSAQQPAPAAQPQPQAQPKQPSSMLPFGQHFKNLFKAAINPVTGPAEIAPQYEKVGNAIFLAAIVIVICSVVGGITATILDVIHFSKYWDTSSAVSSILRDIFYPFFYYAVRTFGFAGLMLLAGLIVKEKFSFPKVLAIASLAVGPTYVVRDLIGSFFGLIPYVGSIINTAMYIYCIVMIYEGITQDAKLTGNKKAFILVSVLAITGVFAGIFSF